MLGWTSLIKGEGLSRRRWWWRSRGGYDCHWAKKRAIGDIRTLFPVVYAALSSRHSFGVFSFYRKECCISNGKKKVGWLSLDGKIIIIFFSFPNFPKFLQWPCITIKSSLKERNLFCLASGVSLPRDLSINRFIADPAYGRKQCGSSHDEAQSSSANRSLS